MGNNIWLSCRVPSPAEELEEDRTPAWCLQAHVISLNGECVGLVERDPVLNSVPELLKTRLCIHYIVLSAMQK